MNHLFVVGAGRMGAGIGQLAAQKGIQATLMDVSDDLAQAGKDQIAKSLQGRVEKGKLAAEEREAILARITPASRLSAASACDFVIEAVVEEIELKKRVFGELAEVVRDDAVLASNTTALSISEMAAATRRPDRLIGMHFFNPPVIMKLVEIIPGMATSPRTVEASRDFALALGKEPVVTKIESPAGIVSRVLAGLLNEAVLVLEAGVASAEDIDKAMKLGTNAPMGPLALLDLIGLDVHLSKMETLHRELGDSRYRTPYLVRKMVKAGRLGVKTGKGFYDYTESTGGKKA
ncbi:MAG: 3-hydroxyacyl-CoA dehydrogenase family protein [Nitrospinota bacterium]